MSYQAAAALQAAIFARLTSFPALAGVSVIDAMPSGPPPGSFVLIGPELVLDQSDKSGGGAEHRFDVAVISDEAGFLTAKQIAGAGPQALMNADLTLAGAVVVSISFMRATARRLGEGAVRRIDMTFRARIAL